MRRLAFIAPLAATLLLVPGAAHADETWLLTFDGGLNVPLTEPQRDWYTPGMAGGAGVYRSLAPWVLVGARLRASALFDGEAPQNPAFEDPDVAGLYTLSGAVRIRPLADADDAARGTGLYLEAAGGPALTEGMFRGSIEAGAGYIFEVGDLGLGPTVRYQHVFQPDDRLSDEDGRFLIAGMELVALDDRPAPPPEPEPEVETDDECPALAEDMDGFQDDDGCPDPDNDGDGISDENDDCPDEPETFNGVNDHDGCPDSGKMEVVNDRIVLDDKVLFDFDESHLRESAYPKLEEVVDLWNSHPEWVGIRIQGHADQRGTEEYNIDLSERRAKAVEEALLERGLTDKRTETVGYGESEPRSFGTSEAAYQRNRRVELVVIRAAEPEGGEKKRPDPEIMDEVEPVPPPPAEDDPEPGETERTGADSEADEEKSR